MNLRSIIVKVIWDADADAGVWVATSDNLLDLNGHPGAELPAEIPLHIMHHQISKVRIRAT